MLALLIFLGVALVASLYFIYIQSRRIKAYTGFKPFRMEIGQIPLYTIEHEKYLATHKDVLKTYRHHLDVNIAQIPENMANPNIPDAELRRWQGKFQAYLEVRRYVDTLIATEVEEK